MKLGEIDQFDQQAARGAYKTAKRILYAYTKHRSNRRRDDVQFPCLQSACIIIILQQPFFVSEPDYTHLMVLRKQSVKQESFHRTMDYQQTSSQLYMTGKC